MPLADNDPSRRNLMVTSLAFIAYFWADGCFTDSTVTLQVVNVSFDKPDVLAKMAWALLFWFALRYWQLHKKLVRETYIKEIRDKANSKITTWYLKRRVNRKDLPVPLGFKVADGSLLIRTEEVIIDEEVDGEHIRQAVDTGDIKVTGFYGRILKIVTFVKLVFQEPGFGSYAVPYVLFAFAVVLGILSGIQ